MANVTNSFLESNKDTFLISISTILSIVALTTILLNATVIFISYKAQCVQKNDRSIYLVSLAVADLTVGITASSMLLGLWLPQKSWIKTFSFCLVGEIIVSIAVAVSAMTLVLISIIQFIAIKFPYLYRRYCSKRLAVTAVICVWIIAIVIISLIFWFLVDIGTTTHIDYCHISKLLGDNKYIFNGMLIGWFMLIMTSIVSLNALTILQIRQRRSLRISNTSSVSPAQTVMRKTSGKRVSRNSIELQNVQENPVLMSPIKEISENIHENSDREENSNKESKYPWSKRSEDYSTEQILKVNGVQVCNTKEMSVKIQADRDTVGTLQKEKSLVNCDKDIQKPIGEPVGGLESFTSSKRRNISVFFFSESNHVGDTTEVHRKLSPKPYLILIVSIAVFVGFLTPTFILTLIESIDEDSVQFDINILRYAVFTGIVINSMLNPLIYTFHMTPYKTYMKSKLKKISRIRPNCNH